MQNMIMILLTYLCSGGLMRSIPSSVGMYCKGDKNSVSLCFLCESLSYLSRFTPSRAEADAHMKTEGMGYAQTLG